MTILIGLLSSPGKIRLTIFFAPHQNRKCVKIICFSARKHPLDTLSRFRLFRCAQNIDIYRQSALAWSIMSSVEPNMLGFEFGFFPASSKFGLGSEKIQFREVGSLGFLKFSCIFKKNSRVFF